MAISVVLAATEESKKVEPKKSEESADKKQDKRGLFGLGYGYGGHGYGAYDGYGYGSLGHEGKDNDMK